MQEFMLSWFFYMTPILQLQKQLHIKPHVCVVSGMIFRGFEEHSDIVPWLDLRSLAFAKQKIGVQGWDADDFRREFLDKPWWKPGIMWIAELDESKSNLPISSSGAITEKRFIGSVTLADRIIIDAEKQERIIPVVHWLMVHPAYRQRGIARALMSRLELSVWENGGREIRLETHQGWEAAGKFYDALEYEIL